MKEFSEVQNPTKSSQSSQHSLSTDKSTSYEKIEQEQEMKAVTSKQFSPSQKMQNIDLEEVKDEQQVAGERLIQAPSKQKVQFEKINSLIVKKKGETQIDNENPLFVKNEVINKNENVLFQISKEPKKIHTIFEFLFNSVTRFILIESGFIYFLQKKKKMKEGTDFYVRSAYKLNRIFTILLDPKDKFQVILTLFNAGFDPKVPPIRKKFEIKNKNEFILNLKNELSRWNYEISMKD